MSYIPQCYLDGKPVEKITAFLFDKGGNENPHKLLANEGKSFQGSIVLGMGFTFDDTNEEATPIAEMERLIAAHPHYQEVIFPYIGGAEVNSSPTHEYYRYAIDFFDRSEEECWEKYPDLMEIVKTKVKPDRDKQKRDALRIKWWQYAEKRPGLKRAIASCDRVLITNAQASVHSNFIFYKPDVVFANSLNIFPLEEWQVFTILQSRIHEVFAWFFSSSMKDDLRYNPSGCFETFPFPENWETNQELEEIGESYYQYRAELMVKNNQGLTDTYNRFHDPTEGDPAIEKLRQLHHQMDQTVLSAYGWQDLILTNGFHLDYFDIEEDQLPPNLPSNIQDRINNNDFFFPTAHEAADFESYVKTGRRSLPWRYRWPQEIHDEILARLLELNSQRHQEEQLLGLEKSRKPRRNSKKTATPTTQGELF